MPQLPHTIRVESEIFEKVISISLTDIAAIQVQGEEGYACPCSDLPVKLSNQRLYTWLAYYGCEGKVEPHKFFRPCPFLIGVKPVQVLILGMRLPVRRLYRVVEDTGLSGDCI